MTQVINLSLKAFEKLEISLITALLCIPIVLFSIMNYEINPAFALSGLLVIALVKKYDKISFTYLLTGVCGIISILVANSINPDGDLLRHFLSFTLIMFAPSFLFLGRYVANKTELEEIWSWLSLFSSLFVIVLASRILILNEAVKIYQGPESFSVMNTQFFGIPVFGSFGILSLAYLICIQALIISGSLLKTDTKITFRWFYITALFCATFLIFGSESRGAQLLIGWIVLTLCIYSLRNPMTWKWSVLAILTIIFAGYMTYSRGMTENRTLETLKDVKMLLNESEKNQTTQDFSIQSDKISSGRVELAKVGIEEVLNSPLIGNGFSGYGRYSNKEKSFTLNANSSCHIYYLTLLWKGGLLFFLPFMAMLLMNFKNILKYPSSKTTNMEKFFAMSCFLMAFGPMTLTWDILIVPSAGALAFFIFGMLGKNCTKKEIPCH